MISRTSRLTTIRSSPANDFSHYCVTAPVDSRLPGGGGEEICGLYDVSPALFGRSQIVVRPASDFGKQTQTYNGIDITAEHSAEERCNVHR